VNHSILVVICDFLVLSVLSLSLGVAPVNSSFTGRGTRIDDYTANILLDELKAKAVQLNKARQELLKAQRKLGYAETRSKRVKKLNEELAQVKSRMNYLEAKLKKRKGEIGKLSREKLLLRLEKENVRRLKVMTEISEAKAALEFEKAKNQELKENLDVLRQDVVRRDDELTEKKTLLEERTRRLQKLASELTEKKARLGKVKGSLKETESALSSAQGRLKKTSAELLSSKQTLGSTQARLKDIALELASSQKMTKASLLDLSYVRGKLSATEKELAESRSTLNKKQKNLAVNELELREAKKQIATLQKILKNAVGDLSQTQKKLDLSKREKEEIAEKLTRTRISLAQTSSKEKATRQALKKIKDSLSDAVQKLRSDALEGYSQAAVYLEMNIQEKRFLMNYSKKRKFYLPEVELDGKTYLVSSIDLLSGMGRIINKSSKINKLSYLIGKPKSSKKMTPVSSPLLSLNIDSRVCLLKIPSVRKKSVKLLTYDKLRKRGLQDLTLFKYNSFGQESCSIDERCSLGLEKGDHYLYIRNSVRRNAPELKADVGDFVISKEGTLVAVAVEVETFDLGRKQRVKCFVFPDKFNLKAVDSIPVIKPSGNKYYRGFAAAVATVNSRIKDMERSKKLRQSR
jgi:predicted  nucleic acid-binding Zn-ribbon protein